MVKLLILWILVLSLNADIISDLKHHEGYSRHAYQDNGHLSIGYGFNLTHGLSQAESELILVHRVAILRAQLSKHPWFSKLNPLRQSIILNMTYNLGYNGIQEFKTMIWCLNNNYFNAASNAMKKSLWYKQTGTRAKYLAKLMRSTP